ncbi:vascular endothelial growth factor receptor 1 [Trichonephila inaurata madagascariensis]|uniref:receptor protein-tyrosine kinase n=1 Tax=Trichonephila inaurata madagascariensis TaxID=2747483 RepID=A0A8X6XYB1_9ARAC|nr:vascular endothelial growth factor receptor 1 [Trichonephila inaurata madagascariensis]
MPLQHVNEDVADVATPKINITEPAIDVKVNSTLYVECTGQQPLSWGYRDPKNRNKKYQDVKAASVSGLSDQGFKSILHLEFTSFLQTGEYSCYDNNESASFYIFVSDDSHLLLPLHYFPFLTLHEGTRSVIPCLPTNSNTNVTLWKVRKPAADKIGLNSGLKYDPTEGFLLRNPTSFFKGNFYCLAEFQDRSENLTLNIDILPQTQSIPEVFIDDSNAKYVLLHSNFTLICNVKIKLGTISSRPKWSHPVKDEKRIITGLTKISKNSIHKMISDPLTIINVQKSDEGIYQCNVTDHSNRENYSQVEIKVYENPQDPVVKFTPGLKKIVKTRGETVELIADYDVFPFTSDIRSIWTKDENHLPPGSDTPAVEIQNATCCFFPEQTYQLQCHSRGFPTPGLSWSWTPIENCATTPCNDKKDWKNVDEGDVNNNTQWFMNVDEENVWSLLNLTARRSGYYKCVSRNEMGFAEKETNFIVSDIKDGFDIEAQTSSPLEMSPFVITCKVSSDLYRDLYWRWTPHFWNESNLNIPKELLTKSITSNSITLTINLENIYLNNTGNYKCFAIPRDEDTAKEKSAIIRVLEIQEPVFLNTNWDTELTAAPNSVLEFNCSVEGTPRPKIVWYRNGEILTSNLTGGKFEDNFQMLVISRLVEDDSGDYACVAENIAGIIMRNMTLNVISSGAPVSASQNASESVQIWILIAVGVSTISVLILLLLLGKWFYRRKYTMMKLQGFNHQLFQEGQFAMFDPNMPLEDQADLLPYDSRWEFGKENLKFGRTLGQGAFGRVVKAEAFGLNDYEKSTTVAVKMLKERADVNQQKALIAELKILNHLGHHVNIVNLMGALIHRDLAARNVLLAEDKVVKICDFGLAKDCYKYENYVKKGDGPLPIKWMAIESIRDHVFTTKSDVWSFGILMWEFFTLGRNPYPGIEIDEEFYKKLSAGYRMERPDYCPEDVYHIMQDCWLENPDDRPRFNEISDTLGGLLNTGVKQHFIDLNAPYLEMNSKMQNHNYLNMPENEYQSNPTRFYMNADTNSSLYDQVPPLKRTIFDTSNASKTLEAVPMVQLDMNKEQFQTIPNHPDTSLHPSDYLKMGDGSSS